MTDNRILHALADLCQEIERQGIIPVNWPSYERAMQVLRANVKAGGSDGPNGKALYLLRDLRSLTVEYGYPTYGLGAIVDDFLAIHTATGEKTNG